MPVKKTDTKESKDTKETKPEIVSKGKDNKDVKETTKEVKPLKEADKKPAVKQPVKQQTKDMIEEDDTDDNESEDDGDKKEADDGNKKKEKKPKKTFDEVLVEYENKKIEIKNKDSLIEEAKKNLKIMEADRDKLDREKNKIIDQFEKAHESDLSKAAKDKPSERKGNPNGGFNKKYKVPAPIVKFCKLDAGSEMNYPDMMSVLNDKFKEGNMKEGQITILNADAAKLFKKEKGFRIGFGEIMTFIKELIEAEAPPKTDTTVKI